MQRQSSPLWHPCTQMKDHEAMPPLQVRSARGSYLELSNGQRVIDAISSWWCKNLGHGHPVLRAALQQQAEQLEHCMLANATHDAVEELSQLLTQLMPGLDRVAYASDGACAVEMAMKMSLHARKLQGKTQKTKFMALQGAYHGETCGALSVSDLGIYKEPYKELCTATKFIKGLPTVTSRYDPLWNDAALYWQRIQQQLQPMAEQLTAIIVEPVLQAANHMQLYGADLLSRLGKWCKQHDVHLIADEIMTGFGRTGKWLACQHAAVAPDFLCLGKSLTAGWLPMSAVMTSNKIYDLFYADYKLSKSFLHSHTFAGNPLAARIAVANFEIIEQQDLVTRAMNLEPILRTAMEDVANTSGSLKNIRGVGMVIAADVKNPQKRPRIGYEVYKYALQHNILLRPLGNTIYWVLPLNVELEIINILRDRLCDILRNMQ